MSRLTLIQPGVVDPPPPVTQLANASQTPHIATRILMTPPPKPYASFDPKFVKIGPSVARSLDVSTRTSAQNVPKICILHKNFCVQNTWKLFIFLKCTISVYLVFRVICLISYILKFIKDKLLKLKQ